MNPATPRQLRVVAIGGGSGLSTLLLGLKRYVAAPGSREHGRRAGDRHDIDAPCLIRELSAVVTVTDDGGSSGRLREDLNILPPGDIRNCMVALSEDEHLLSRLFQYRFEQGALEGHSFGNLFVAALSGITGDFAQAVHMSSQILATRGRIYPATNANATLAALMDDGSVVHGEADIITIGPGSLYTSLITNLLVRGIPEALRASHATRVFVCNLMTQANESLGLTASEHIEKIFDHAGVRIFDCALINTGPIPPDALERYAAEGQSPIEADLDRIRALGVEPITGNFVHKGEVLRHAYEHVAEPVLQLALHRVPVAV